MTENSEIERIVAMGEIQEGAVFQTKEEPQKRNVLDWVIRVMSVVFTAYMFYATIFGPYKTTLVHRAIFLAVMLFIFFSSEKPLKLGKKGHMPRAAKVLDWLLIAFVTIALGYIVINYKDILNLVTATRLQTWQIVLGVVILIAVLETARRTSVTFYILAVVGCLYTMFGNHLGGLFQHAGMSFRRMIFLTVFTEEGVFGLGLSVASTYLFMFILFGACLQGTGASVTLMDVCNGLVGHRVGGAAKTAVIGSALMGTISGSSISNVVTTGSITIPLMKKLGFKPHVAAAVEVTASEGGQLMPPIMGAAAFIMAEMTGIPYSTIALAAVIPAFLYFFNAYLVVHFEAKRSGIKGLPKEELPNWKKALKDGWHLIAPIAVLFYLLLGRNNTTMYSGLFCVVFLIISAQLRKGTRMSISKIIDIVEDGVRNVASIMAILSALGLVTQAITVTGLGARLSSILVQLVGGSTVGIVAVGIVATIILGCGMTTPVAYSLVAIFVAPSLIEVGFPVLAAHMFLFFFAIKSGSTPPVAVVAAVAAGIAGADFWKTAIKGTVFGCATYLVALGYLYDPALLLQGSPGFIIISTCTAIVGVLGMAGAIQGWMFTRCSPLERVLMFAGAACMIVPETYSDLVGIAIMVVVLAASWLKRKKELVART